MSELDGARDDFAVAVMEYFLQQPLDDSGYDGAVVMCKALDTFKAARKAQQGIKGCQLCGSTESCIHVKAQRNAKPLTFHG